MHQPKTKLEHESYLHFHLAYNGNKSKQFVRKMHKGPQNYQLDII